jgi:hypothetical protein
MMRVNEIRIVEEEPERRRSEDEYRPECVDRVIESAHHASKFTWTDADLEGVTWETDETEKETDDDGAE